ncbi:UNVERIFIED_CONTAM: hypothetical protein NY603_30390, partial [Bacteroidetes bacterium 56_B9]
KAVEAASANASLEAPPTNFVMTEGVLPETDTSTDCAIEELLLPRTALSVMFFLLDALHESSPTRVEKIQAVTF